MKKKLLLIAMMGLSVASLDGALAQPAAPPAPAAPGQTPPPPRVYPPAHDFSGKWVAHIESTDRNGVKTVRDQVLMLVQNENQLTGMSQRPTSEPPIPPGGVAPPRANVPGPTMPISIYGWTEGDQTTLQSDFAFDGGEHMRWILNFKDGHWVGTRVGTHDAPHKYRLDTNVNVDYQKAE